MVEVEVDRSYAQLDSRSCIDVMFLGELLCASCESGSQMCYVTRVLLLLLLLLLLPSWQVQLQIIPLLFVPSSLTTSLFTSWTCVVVGDGSMADGVK